MEIKLNTLLLLVVTFFSFSAYWGVGWILLHLSAGKSHIYPKFLRERPTLKWSIFALYTISTLLWPLFFTLPPLLKKKRKNENTEKSREILTKKEREGPLKETSLEETERSGEGTKNKPGGKL